MKVDKGTMHETELIDNCFFASKEKAEAMAQTVVIEVAEQALSARTMVSGFTKYAHKGAKSRQTEDRDLNEIAKSIRVRGNRKLGSDMEEDLSHREMLKSDRQLLDRKARKAELVGEEDRASSTSRQNAI